MRITDDVSLLNWIPHSVVRFMHKLGIGRKWRKPMVQHGKKNWFQKIGEEGINSTLKRLYLEQPFVCGFDSLCEDIHVTTQCHTRQHDACLPSISWRRHSSWKDSLKMKYSKIRSELSEYTWKAKASLIHLESYLEERAQEVWERSMMNLDMRIVW